MRLARGSRGDEVRCLQHQLNEAARQPLQFSKFPPLVVDGVFEGATHARLQEFQIVNGLVPDGVSGPRTHELLDALVGPVEIRRPVGGAAGSVQGKWSPAGDKDVVAQLSQKKWYPAADYGKLPADRTVPGMKELGGGASAIDDVKGIPTPWIKKW